MLHIIDANNLAGKLGLLGQNDFDKRLVEIVKEHYQGKKIGVFLVFDSIDLMGDRSKEGFVTVIYTPRDNFYASADDKIVELAELSEEKQIRVVTDDLEIIEKVEKVGEKGGKDIQILKASEFAEKLQRSGSQADDEEIDEEAEEKITNEFLELWK